MRARSVPIGVTEVICMPMGRAVSSAPADGGAPTVDATNSVEPLPRPTVVAATAGRPAVASSATAALQRTTPRARARSSLIGRRLSRPIPRGERRAARPPGSAPDMCDEHVAGDRAREAGPGLRCPDGDLVADEEAGSLLEGAGEVDDLVVRPLDLHLDR